jgi:acetyl-CoA C-acetyltransferase
MADAMIFDALRTPRGKGKQDGSLAAVAPVELMSGLLRALEKRTHLDPASVDDVVLGCVTPVAEQGFCIGKMALLAADWDCRVAGMQLNRFCASGLEAVNLAAQKVRSDWEDLVVAGGVESMSRVAMGSDGGPWPIDPVTSQTTGLVPQGIGADLLATIEGFDRETVDSFALASQRKAEHAQKQGYFERSVVAVTDATGKTVLSQDEFIKPQTTLEALAALRPAFERLGASGFDDIALAKYSEVARINHVHTAGNSSGIVDGAAALLIGSLRKGRQMGLIPRARIVATAVSGADPTIMLTGPMPAVRKLLQKAQLDIDEIDLFEINEAFAAVPLCCAKQLHIPLEKINVNGGAIALGHPLGATGAMLVGTLLDELERRSLRYGIATLCAGGGMGIATLIERV